MKTNKIDIATVQETKLANHHKIPLIPQYSTHRTDRTHKKGGGLITFVKHNINFTPLNTPNNINRSKTELHTIKIHLTQTKHLHITNIYIPPRDTTDPNHATEDTDITNTFTHLTNIDNHLITGDINAHSHQWHSPTEDHRGSLIANSNQITLNTNTPTRITPHANQQPTSPDITTITNTLQRNTDWTTMQALSSDHLPIVITYRTKTNYKIQQHRRTYTDYNKANWQEFTQETEQTLADTTKHTYRKKNTNQCYTRADKHHIPKGKIHHTQKLLPQHIRNMIKQRNTRQQNPKDPLLTQQNTNIDKEIQNHKQALWKQHLANNWDHKTNSHTLWKTLNGLAHKKTPQTPNITITFDNKTAITDKQKAEHFNKQFTNHVKHTTQWRYRIIDRFTNRLKSTPIQITIEQTSLAIKQAKNNNSIGPDNINIQHLGVTALTYLTAIFNLSLNTNTIPHTWKIAKIIPIPKPGKHTT